MALKGPTVEAGHRTQPGEGGMFASGMICEGDGLLYQSAASAAMQARGGDDASFAEMYKELVDSSPEKTNFRGLPLLLHWSCEAYDVYRRCECGVMDVRLRVSLHDAHWSALHVWTNDVA
jgi:hypothetical protein